MTSRSRRTPSVMWAIALLLLSSLCGAPSAFAGDDDAEASFERGHNAYYGKGVAKDRKKALRYFRKACDADHVEGCLWAGKLYANGDGGERDPAKAQAEHERALVILERRCREANVEACLQASPMLRQGVDNRGRGVNKDVKKADELESIARNALTKRCQEATGDQRLAACDALIGIYSDGDKNGNSIGKNSGDNDYALSGVLAQKLSALDTACTGGSWKACHQLSELHSAGKAVAKDMDMANAYFDAMVNLRLQACRDGSADDCLELGQTYLRGEGVAEKSLERAEKLFRHACKLESKAGCRALKDMGRP